MYKKSRYDSPIGRMVMIGKGEVLCALWFKDQDSFVFRHPAEEGELSIFSDVRRWLDAYFSRRVPDFLPLLSMEGTPFQKTVWDILRQIPYGKTTTYGEIAKTISAKTGKPMSAQAVGGAVGKNPISIIIPCHRVIGADGSLTGYAGGLWRKRFLLELESGKFGQIVMSDKK